MVQGREVKIGDLVCTTCFGPAGSVGEIGILIRQADLIIRCWVVLFSGSTQIFSRDGLEVINES